MLCMSKDLQRKIPQLLAIVEQARAEGWILKMSGELSGGSTINCGGLEVQTVAIPELLWESRKPWLVVDNTKE